MQYNGSISVLFQTRMKMQDLMRWYQSDTDTEERDDPEMIKMIELGVGEGFFF